MIYTRMYTHTHIHTHANTHTHTHTHTQGKVSMTIKAQQPLAWARSQELFVTQGSATPVDLISALQQSLPSALRQSVAWRISLLPAQGEVRRVYVCGVCVCVCVYIYTYLHIYIFTYLHIYIFTYLHIYTYTYIHMYTYT